MNVALALYAAIAALFLVLALEEGRRKRLPWDAYRISGLAMSLAWPLVIAVVTVMALREALKRRDAK